MISARGEVTKYWLIRVYNLLHMTQLVNFSPNSFKFTEKSNSALRCITTCVLHGLFLLFSPQKHTICPGVAKLLHTALRYITSSVLTAVLTVTSGQCQRPNTSINGCESPPSEAWRDLLMASLHRRNDSKQKLFQCTGLSERDYCFRTGLKKKTNLSLTYPLSFSS